MAINLFVASGNLGKDCEQRFTQNGKCIASFSLPVKQGYGEHEKVSWVTCKMFGAKADKLPQYLTKGSKVTVTGEFVLEKWQDQSGVEKSMPVIIVNDIDFGGKQEGQQRHQSQPQGQPQQSQYNDVPVNYDDAIPFAPIGLQYSNHLIHVI